MASEFRPEQGLDFFPLELRLTFARRPDSSSASDEYILTTRARPCYYSPGPRNTEIMVLCIPVLGVSTSTINWRRILNTDASIIFLGCIRKVFTLKFLSTQGYILAHVGPAHPASYPHRVLRVSIDPITWAETLDVSPQIGHLAVYSAQMYPFAAFAYAYGGADRALSATDILHPGTLLLQTNKDHRMPRGPRHPFTAFAYACGGADRALSATDILHPGTLLLQTNKDHRMPRGPRHPFTAFAYACGGADRALSATDILHPGTLLLQTNKDPGVPG
ncbi:hypothetical protein B0H17DRAFT_1149062 [Mycena rosella]|uniref:Uncharacterized protein n=1 Tax=Mycena rosella TaxID=1033263 RepID=A0AAD7C8A5_MYCRO|nr:hypothetical protein B0H17DRAFT_1149062 [Mycena rosella]